MKIDKIEDLVKPDPKELQRQPLSVSYPKIAAQWYHPRNCNWGPENFSARSDVAVWWRCDKRHIWQEIIRHRTTYFFDCPECAQGKPIVNLDYCPEALLLFDKEKNEGIDPHQLPLEYQARWRCPKGPDHAWKGTFYTRAGNRCPFCRRNPKVLSEYPDIAAQLHEKNGLSANDIPCGSKLHYWWICSAGPDHIWRAKVPSRIAGSGNCPFCANRQVSITNCLATLHPSIAKYWHPTKNGLARPENVIARTGTMFYWYCSKCNEEWRQSLAMRIKNGPDCPRCPKAEKRKAKLQKQYGWKATERAKRKKKAAAAKWAKRNKKAAAAERARIKKEVLAEQSAKKEKEAKAAETRRALAQRVPLAVARVLSKRREQMGLKQYDLAYMTRMHRSSIDEVERGARDLSIKNLYLLANSLNLKAASFIRRIDQSLAEIEVEKSSRRKSGRKKPLTKATGKKRAKSATAAAITKLSVVTGRVLLRQREKLGLSQSDLARITGLHRSYIGDVERGGRNISVKNLSILAKSLNLKASKLMKLIEEF